MKEELLYQQYDPWKKHPDVFQRDFYPEPVKIRLRPFFIDEDLSLFNEWMQARVRSANTSMTIATSIFPKTYFAALLESTNAQSFWGLINNAPGFQFDIYRALDYHLQEYDWPILLPGDLMLQLTVCPNILGDERLARHILPACVEYLSDYPEVKRVFWIIDQNDESFRLISHNDCLSINSVSDGAGKAIDYVHLQF